MADQVTGSSALRRLVGFPARRLTFLALAAALVLGCGHDASTTPGAVAEARPAPPAPVTLAERASPARVVEAVFWSAALGRNMPISVYLPPGYDSGREPLPVLYMLHPLGGNRNDWQQWGLFDTATRLIEARLIPPLVIVSPEGENGYWMNHAGGGPRYGSYVSQDVIAYVDASFRTLPHGAFRAIGGMSMGAHGALQLALNNPGRFSIVGAHSLVLRTKQQALPFFGDQAYFEQYDPVTILAKNPERARGLTIWIDIGAGDTWMRAAERFHGQLQGLSVQHRWNVWPGGHDAAYCASHLVDYLSYYGDAFAAQLEVVH